MGWTPTRSFLLGTINKAFVPYSKIPNFHKVETKNFYPGEEVLIFEINNNWARGYVSTEPFPNEFTIPLVDFDQMPQERIGVYVFPLSVIDIIDEISINLHGHLDVTETDNNEQEEARRPLPGLPKRGVTKPDLVTEIVETLEIMVSHSFALYSIGEFMLFQEFSQIYTQLDEIRLFLVEDQLTSFESEKAKATASYLLNRIPKQLLSKNARYNAEAYGVQNFDSDVRGYKTILARDREGSLLSRENHPTEVANSQVICNYSPAFPIKNEINPYFHYPNEKIGDRLLHNCFINLVISVHSFEGLLKEQTNKRGSFVVNLYIRNRMKRLTETFSIYTDLSHELSNMGSLGRAVFNQIPKAEIENNRTYFVISVDEILDMDFPYSDLSISPSRRGLVAGIADITRVFTKMNHSFTGNDVHVFNTKVFGSYMPKKQHIFTSRSMNDGWGYLADRILEGCSDGIAINNLVRSFLMTVREIDNCASFRRSEQMPFVRPLHYNPLNNDVDFMCLNIGALKLRKPLDEDSELTLEVRGSKSLDLLFCGSSNGPSTRFYRFVNVLPDEGVGEIVKITGMNLGNTKDSKVTLFFSLYVGIDVKGKGELVEYPEGAGDKKASFVIREQGGSGVLAEVEYGALYAGQRFKNSNWLETIENHEKLFNGQSIEEPLLEALDNFREIDANQIIMNFTGVQKSLFSMTNSLSPKVTTNSARVYRDRIFFAVVHLFDTIFSRKKYYSYLLEDLLLNSGDYPYFLEVVVERLAQIFSRADSKWDSTSRALCRVLAILVKHGIRALPSNCKDGSDPYLEYQMGHLFFTVRKFLLIKSQELLTDQVVLLDNFDYLFDDGTNYTNNLLMHALKQVLDAVGERCFESGKENEGQHISRLLRTQLIILNRLFHRKSLLEHFQTRAVMKEVALKWVTKVVQFTVDDICIRITCTILNTVCVYTWTGIFSTEKEEHFNACHSLLTLLPSLTKGIIAYDNHMKLLHLNHKKKQFTYLFQLDYPFERIPGEIYVEGEVMVEQMIELSSLVCFISRIGREFFKMLGYKIFDPSNKTLSGSNAVYSEVFSSKNLRVLFYAISIILEGQFYPKMKCLTLNATYLEGCYCLLEFVKHLISSPHVSEAIKDKESLSKKIFKTGLNIIISQPVSTEELAVTSKRACNISCGKIYHSGLKLLENIWTSSKKYDISFYESLVRDYTIVKKLIQLALQESPYAIKISARILCSIIFMVNEGGISLDYVNRDCVTGIFEKHEHFNSRVFKNLRKSFIKELQRVSKLEYNGSIDDTLKKVVDHWLGFLNVLDQFNDIPRTKEFEEDRIYQKFAINEYLKDAGMPELYYSFVSHVYKQNVRKHAYVQAALTLELATDSMEWDHEQILSRRLELGLPEQLAFDRKVTLKKFIADNYFKGNCLEKAVDTYNELLNAYHQWTYDMKSFAYVHDKLSKLYTKLESSEILEPSYFKVTLLGSGFSGIKGTVFIYEGLPFEHITSLYERLQRLHPGSRFISDDKRSTGNLTGKYFNVAAVKPRMQLSTFAKTSISVKQYERNRDRRYFVSIKRLPGANSVYDLWAEKTIYETRSSFPALLNRSEIKSTKVIKLSPLDNAIRTLDDKNSQLLQIERLLRLKTRNKDDCSYLFSDLSRQLFGTVDSPVNGGAGLYRKFFENKTDEERSEYSLLEEQLNDLARILSRCLKLHEELSPPSFEESHKVLVSMFETNFATEIRNLGLANSGPEVMANGLQLSSRLERYGSRDSVISDSSSLVAYSLTRRSVSLHHSDSATHSSRSSTENGEKRS